MLPCIKSLQYYNYYAFNCILIIHQRCAMIDSSFCFFYWYTMHFVFSWTTYIIHQSCDMGLCHFLAIGMRSWIFYFSICKCTTNDGIGFQLFQLVWVILLMIWFAFFRMTEKYDCSNNRWLCNLYSLHEKWFPVFSKH